MALGVVLQVLIFVSNRFMRAAKVVNAVSILFLLIGIILVPCGCVGHAWVGCQPHCCRYNNLSDVCGADDNSCGLVCYNGGYFYPFGTCDPWVLGNGMYLLCAGTFIIFISTFAATCVRYYPGACMCVCPPPLTRAWQRRSEPHVPVKHPAVRRNR